jgi:protocatechuate 3,4-dioxygenase beta subunit
VNGYREIILTPKELQNRKVIQKKIILNKYERIVLTGTILDTQCMPVENAVIVIREVIEASGIRNIETVGYAITNQEGEFAIILEKSDYKDYLLDVYEPILC